ncbi:hypothetical protein LY76DRAFT_536098 [Colletotrichum caudatum]|nr:hypothetical protein LY76DRAFT_536098 [Colletotrichum caudatum]
MAPGNTTGVTKKKQNSAAASRNKANLSKGKSNVPKVKAHASATKPNATGPPQAAISSGRHKRQISPDEEDINDDGTMRPAKRRKGGKGPNSYDYHAVRFQPGRDNLSSRMSSPETLNNKNAFPLMKLPIEIRRKIYKEILVVKDPIRVRQGWSAVYPRNRPMVGTGILRACRQVRNEAVDVLYGENTFLYLLRETAKLPATKILGENEIVVHHPLMADELSLSEYEANSDDEYDEDDLLPEARSARDPEIEIDICRYGHKFRKLMIVAEPNRFDKGYLLSMANAIGVFRNLKPLRARVHTITIEITPIRQVDTGEISFLDFFEKTSEVIRTLKGLPCQFIEVLVNTGGGNQERIRLNMKYAARIRRARRGQEDIWEHDQVMQSYRGMKAGEAQRSLEKLSTMIRDIWEEPNGRFVGSLAGDDESDEEGDFDFFDF